MTALEKQESRVYNILCKVYDNKKINKRDVEFINNIMYDVEHLLRDFNKGQDVDLDTILTTAYIGWFIVGIADNCEYSKSCEDQFIYIDSVDYGLRGELQKLEIGE